MNKLLPIFVMPLFVGLGLMLLGLVLRRRWLGVLGVALVWVAATPIVGTQALRWIEAGYQRGLEAGAPEADVIVVLSGGRHPAPGPHRVSEWTDPDRFFAGVALWEVGKAPLLVFTGGGPTRPGMQTEGEILRDAAIRMGVDSAAIVVTGRVATTIDEAEALACLVTQGGPRTPGGVAAARRILLVTSAFHLPRATRAFEHHGFEVVGFPVDFQSTEPRGWRATMLLPSSVSLRDTELAGRELIGRVIEQLRGLGPAPGCVVA